MAATIRPFAVLQAVEAAINAMDVAAVTPGDRMRATIGARKARSPGRDVTVVPGGSRRLMHRPGTCNEHEMQVTIVTYYPLSADVFERIANDQADMADALLGVPTGAIIGIEVDLGVPANDIATENEIAMTRSVTVRFRKGS